MPGGDAIQECPRRIRPLPVRSRLRFLRWTPHSPYAPGGSRPRGAGGGGRPGLVGGDPAAVVLARVAGVAPAEPSYRPFDQGEPAVSAPASGPIAPPAAAVAEGTTVPGAPPCPRRSDVSSRPAESPPTDPPLPSGGNATPNTAAPPSPLGRARHKGGAVGSTAPGRPRQSPRSGPPPANEVRLRVPRPPGRARHTADADSGSAAPPPVKSACGRRHRGPLRAKSACVAGIHLVRGKTEDGPIAGSLGTMASRLRVTGGGVALASRGHPAGTAAVQSRTALTGARTALTGAPEL